MTLVSPVFDLEKILRENFQLSAEDLKRSIDSFSSEKYPAKASFLKQGEIAGKLGLVMSGILRSFVYDDQANEITTHFFKPGHVVISMKSFNNQIPSEENIDVLEDAELLVISYEEMMRLYHSMPEWKQIAKRTDEIKFQSQMNRAIKFQTLSAKERYHLFCERHPDLIQKVALKHVASYLGMDIATLSRIRKAK